MGYFFKRAHKVGVETVRSGSEKSYRRIKGSQIYIEFS